MRLGSASYYADFVVYPIAIIAAMVFAFWEASPQRTMVSLTSFIIGVALWTLAEYLLHRFVFHHVPRIKTLHESHHQDQTALIGTPTWLSLAMIAGLVLLPSQLLVPSMAIGLTAGWMVGYLWYVSAHHIVHHARIHAGTYAYRLKRRHMLHHHFDDGGNFGVTSGFWDKVFGTDIDIRRPGSQRRLPG